MESFSQANQEAIVFIEKNQKSAWFNKAAAALLLLPDDTSDPTLIIEALNSLSKNSINASETEEQLPRLLTENIKDEEFKLHIQYANYSISITYASISWGHMDGSLWLLKKNFQNTDPELAKSQIQELSNLLTSVLNSSLSGIMAFRTIRDDKNNIIDFECLIVNEKAKKLLKKKEYELIGESLRNIFPVYLKDDLFDQYKGVVETGNSIYLEQSQDINGYKTWSNINVVKLEDGLAVIFTDITTRKNAEEKLKRNQAKLKAVLENTNDFIWSFNNEYLITTINTAFQEKVFHQTGQILKVGNKFDLNIFPKDVIPQWEGYFNRAFLGERFTEEVKIKVLEAEYFLEYSFNPIKDREQNIIGVAIFGRDISKRRKAEREIRQKSQMLNSLLNNLPVYVFRLDQEGRIIEAMGAALKNLNIREDMILNIKAEELFPEVKKAFKKVKKGKSVKFQSSKTHEGQEYVFEKIIFPDETNVGGAIGFAMDVTDLIKIEMELQSAKESAERAIKAKNYFLANMSHDLRTPIHTILGFARELQGNINSSDAVNYLHYIISSGELLYKLVDDILELTKIEEGKLHLKEEPFNFEETLLSNLYPYQYQANEKGLDFKIHFDDNLPKYCIGDAGKISRIIINIIGNSLKFTEKGYIHLSFSSLNPTNNERIKNIKVVVKDTGIGVAKEKQKLIFNSFTQAEPSINKTYGGSGLGLAVVKELVQLMGGEFGVESPVNDNAELGGLGSAFWITLPLKEVHHHQIEERDEILYDAINFHGNLKVLLVEDNILNQQLVKIILSKIGCIVTLSDNGKESIETLETGTFDLIIMDVQMPLMDGIETTKYIRKELGLKIPIIGLSAHIYKDDIENCLNAGMNDYLSKPFSETALMEKIYKWTSLDPQKFTSNPEIVEKATLTDLSFLNELYNGDYHAVKQMVDEFFNFQNQLLKQMEEQLDRHDYYDLASLAHSMRSSIRTIGFESLYEPLIVLEKAAIRGNDHQKIKEMLEKINSLNRQASQELKNSL